MNTAAEIYELIETTGKSAPDISQSLKNIGGDMQTGIKKIATFFYDDGYLSGEKNGLFKGSLIGLAVPLLFGAGYYLYDKHKAKAALRAHKANGKEILDGFKSATSSDSDIVLCPSGNNCPNDTENAQQIRTYKYE